LDGDYQTTVCGVPGGDDLAAVPTGAIYQADTPGPPQSTSTLDFGTLSDGRYRLIGCAALTDEAGNALDGGAFARDFRVDAGNLFLNGHFDCGDASWLSTPAVVAWDGSVDQDGSLVSGSELVDSGAVSMASIAQCVDLAGAASPLALAGSTAVAAAPGVQIGMLRRCDFYAGPACGGALLGTVAGGGSILEDSGGTFVTGGAELSAPLGAVSARCGFEVLSPNAESFQLWLAGASLVGNGPLFADGFESGDTSAWSTVVP
jgi:hypothetical protein